MAQKIENIPPAERALSQEGNNDEIYRVICYLCSNQIQSETSCLFHLARMCLPSLGKLSDRAWVPRNELSSKDTALWCIRVKMRRAAGLLSNATWSPPRGSVGRRHLLSTLRHASTSAPPPSAPSRFLSSTLILAASGAFVAYYYDSRAVLHDQIAMPFIRLLDPEQGHQMAVKLLSWNRWFRPSDRRVDGPELKAEVSRPDCRTRQCTKSIAEALRSLVCRSRTPLEWLLASTSTEMLLMGCLTWVLDTSR